jgi:hypothetical protein
MAKSMIINTLGGKNLTSYVPCDATVAQTFAEDCLEGKYSIYEEKSVVGTDTASTARYVTVQIKDETLLSSRFMNFIIKTSKNEGDVITALAGKTFDGIKADKVVVVSMRSAQY